MKKLVAVTTTILIILIAVLGIFMIKGHGSDSSTAKSTLSDLKESLSDKEDTKAAEASKDSDADKICHRKHDKKINPVIMLHVRPPPLLTPDKAARLPRMLPPHR